ncbi:MAG: Ig-like domain-containing protein [Eubacterium sp.]|nr:Ig-like domain-containing protein [Eubacterium sp.]
MVKRILACLITLTLVFTSVNFSLVQTEAKVKLNKKQVLVRIGSPVKLKVKNAKKKRIKWKSSNKKIATVSKKGVVKGKDDGKCTVTAKVGKKKLKCIIVVAHIVAKKTSAKTMAAVTKQIKKKGTYIAESKCYRYIKKFKEDNRVFIGNLRYYPSGNYLEFDAISDTETITLTFKVGDKRKCKFEYKDGTYDYNVVGIWDVNRLKDEASSLSFTSTNIPEGFHDYAKNLLFPYVRYQAYMFDRVMKELKTKVYTESFGFNYPMSNYFE